MRNWKHWAFVAIIAIFGLTIAVTACDNDPSPPETFTVTFNANGGTPQPQAQTIEKGKTATEPQGVTKANNTLDGWYTESAFTTKWNFAANPVTAPITLHAKWLCNCTNKLHLVGETCCEGAGCTCDKNVAGQRVEGIAVTNRDNVANFNAMVTNVTEALSWFNTAQKDYIGSNIKEIKIVVGTGGINPPLSGVFTVGNDCSDDDIFGTLETWVDTNMQ